MIALTLALCFAATFSGCGANAKKSYLHDAESLIQTIESTHPAFSLNEISARYTEAKETFINSAGYEMTKNEFRWCAQRYLASLNDGHTNVQGLSWTMFIDISWRSEGERLFLTDLDGIATDKEVISIGGVSVSDIFYAIDSYYAIENEAAKERNHTLWSRSKDLLLMAGGNADNNRVSVSIKSGDSLSDAEYTVKRADIYEFYNHSSAITSEIMDNVFYIDYNACELGGGISKVTASLERALSEGITSVIIDARDNPGGNSEANKALLTAMGMAEPQYGIYLRYSPLLSKQWGREEDSGFVEYPRDMSAIRKNPVINLAVLVNENTYSSATDLGVTVQDGKLGTIIGQISSNAPNSYGDVLSYVLPDSKIKVNISCKRFLRPDENADPYSLIPDIITPRDEDALNIALDFLGSF